MFKLTVLFFLEITLLVLVYSHCSAAYSFYELFTIRKKKKKKEVAPLCKVTTFCSVTPFLFCNFADILPAQKKPSRTCNTTSLSTYVS